MTARDAGEAEGGRRPDPVPLGPVPLGPVALGAASEGPAGAVPGRTAVWQAIEAALAADLAAGRYGPGDRLPSEARLAERFGVHRHTVRRALGALAEAGLVRPRRGAGVFAIPPEGARADYPLGPRVRYTEAIERAGRAPGRRVLRVETRAASRSEAEALGLAPGDRVHVHEGIALADGRPVALVHGVFPAARLPGLPEALRREGSVTAALAACGVPDYARRRTRVTAEAATAIQARHLELPEGAPLLRTDALNVEPDGRPVERGRTWFAGARVALTVGEDGA